MREFINLFEDEEIIRKRNIDKRDMEQKLLDIIDHPSTEPFLKQVAERKLKKLRDAAQAEENAAAAARDKVEADRNLPTLDVQVNIGWAPNFKPLDPSKWDEVFVSGYGGTGKKVTYRQIIERVMPLNPFRIDFDPTRWEYMTAYHVTLWFHPEDEPENGQAITKAFNTPTKLWGSVADGDGTYLRGGQSKYTIWFDRKAFGVDKKKKR